MVFYQYSCCSTAFYIGVTTRQLRKRIKQHVPKNVDNFCCLDKKDDILAKVLNVSKRSSIAEHLVNNPTCANSYNMNRLEIIKTYNNVFDLIKLEVICILLRKLVLCKKNEFDYSNLSHIYAHCVHRKNA